MAKVSAVLKAKKAKTVKKTRSGKSKTRVEKLDSGKKRKEETLKGEVKKLLKDVKNGKEPLEDEGLDLNMSMDDFLNDGSEEPTEVSAPKKIEKAKKEKKSKKSKKKVEEPVQEEEEESSESEDEADIDPETYQKQLQELKEKDPDFYKYLERNDEDLLNFNAKTLEEEVEDDLKEAGLGSSQVLITDEIIARWQTAMSENHSLNVMQKVIQAFKAAAYFNEEGSASLKYTISDPKIFNGVLLLALKEVPAVLQHHFPIKKVSEHRQTIDTSNKRLAKLSTSLRSYGLSLLHILEGMSDAKNLSLLLREAKNVTPYLMSHRKFLKAFTQAVVAQWGTNRDDSVRASAFMLLRELCISADAALAALILRSVYLTFVRQCGHTSVHTLDGINFMKNSAVELMLLEESSCYQTAYRYIRQLAITLRNVIQHPGKETLKLVQNWSYIHSLDLWARLLSKGVWLERERKSNNGLSALVYPLVQIALGVVRVAVSAQYFPLRFHVIRVLLFVAQQCGVSIPIAPLLFEVLNSSEMKRKPRPSTLKALDFQVEIHAPTTYLHTRIFQEGVADQVSELLLEYCTLYCKSIAMPEISIPVIVHLKRFIKRSKNIHLNRSLLTLVRKLEANAAFVQEKRVAHHFAPIALEEGVNFMKDVEWTSTPLGAFAAAQRSLREEQRKLLMESVQQDQEHKEAVRRKKRDALRNSNNEDVEVDMEVESEDDDAMEA
ncbi:noc complex subunit Noc2 family protein [Schizosaccharomyces japonicus yFS275]|uniref:Noc complex subunit Noc2 family protein n=1 Tax=Schizosaccharomyces japonicus (strain yFS275 / FY16936) TaxID=402676 RepID=B6JY35_SCHJY|nr:noc complex subunit Noc2 family protein [Schizosaccharomyces japonicus yFS275]EEB06453.1 noc complex subunit Noc2 family protein [Schizosaccharomyces japonicus yFS275]